MDAVKIRLITIATAVALVVVVEVVALAMVSADFCDPLAATLAARIIEIVLILSAISIFQDFPKDIGLSRVNLRSGIKTGLVWSLIFGGLAAGAFALIAAFGINPLRFFNLRLDGGWKVVLFFFLTGAVVAPFAEELFFRGLFYGFFRRWGVWTGVVVSTLVFSLFHMGQTSLPLTQVVGGVVFCLAYERAKSLYAPCIIHGLGNAAIFALGMGANMP